MKELNAQNNFYITLCSVIPNDYRKACAKEFKSESHVCGWFPGLQNLELF